MSTGKAITNLETDIGKLYEDMEDLRERIGALENNLEGEIKLLIERMERLENNAVMGKLG